MFEPLISILFEMLFDLKVFIDSNGGLDSYLEPSITFAGVFEQTLFALSLELISGLIFITDALF